MTKEKIVSSLKLDNGFGQTAMWRVKNAAYEFIDAKAKKKIKEMGFRSWLGTLPKPALLKIQRNLVPYQLTPVKPYETQPTPWLDRFNEN